MTVLRLMPSSPASSRDDGSDAPASSRPSRIACTTARRRRACSGSAGCSASWNSRRPLVLDRAGDIVRAVYDAGALARPIRRIWHYRGAARSLIFADRGEPHERPQPPVTEATLAAFSDAWNRHDVDALMSFMHDDCVFQSRRRQPTPAARATPAARRCARRSPRPGRRCPMRNGENGRHFVQRRLRRLAVDLHRHRRRRQRASRPTASTCSRSRTARSC